MKYVYLVDGKTVHDIQPGKSKDFPGVSMKDRFSAEYLSHCIEVNDAVEVESGWVYNSEAGIFRAPPEPEISEDEALNRVTIEAPKEMPAPTIAEDLMRMVIEQEYLLSLHIIGLEEL